MSRIQIGSNIATTFAKVVKFMKRLKFQIRFCTFRLHKWANFDAQIFFVSFRQAEVFLNSVQGSLTEGEGPVQLTTTFNELV
jgi:hypothetical protein